MNGSFNEQLGGVTGLFDQWGACERTVVACTLARRVPWPGLRLLQRAVEAALRHHVADERLERDANDEVYIAGLLSAPPTDDDEDDAEKRMHKLLSLIPLLRTDNERCARAWVSGAGALAQRCVDSPRRAPPPDLCRQLLRYLLLHPALQQADHRTLTQWLRYLENHMSGNRSTESVWQQRMEPSLLPEPNIWSSATPFRRTIGKNVFRTVIDPAERFTDPLQESFSKNGRDVDISTESDRLNFDAAISQPKSQRSNSLTPPSSSFMQTSSSAENLSDEPFVVKPRSFSLSSEHSSAPLRPFGLLGSAGSETRLDDLRCGRDHTAAPGMSTVAQWLKSLRLHKYVWLFTNITYERMMAMDEGYLEKLGVTKGARHKILASIRKLSERGAALEALQAELAARPPPPALARALARLRALLLAPMAPAGPLPPALVRALHLASQCLETCEGGGARPVGEEAEPTPLSLHCWLVEKALHHEAFRSPELREALVGLRHRLPPRQFFHHVGDMPHHRRGSKVGARPQMAAVAGGEAPAALGGGGRGPGGAPRQVALVPAVPGRAAAARRLAGRALQADDRAGHRLMARRRNSATALDPIKCGA